MPLNEIASDRAVHPLIEMACIPVNLVLGIALYAAEQNLRDGGFLKNNLTVLSERAFYVGVAALIVAILLRFRMKSAIHRFGIYTVITLFNQACLISLLVSTIPFKLH
jgi:hypothetical protein